MRSSTNFSMDGAGLAAIFLASPRGSSAGILVFCEICLKVVILFMKMFSIKSGICA